jgi:PIN domain nuclease of toxin-antitoxin system
VTALLDTHVLIWWIRDDPRLSRSGRVVIDDSANKRLVSYASLWEIAIKSKLGKLSVGGLDTLDLARALEKLEFILLPIQLEHISGLEKLDILHRDPFDRLLIAQAQELGVPLITNDAKIRQYPVKTIW